VGIVYSGISKDGKGINFSQFQDLVEHLRSALQQIGYELDDVCKILAKDNEGNTIEDGANEQVSQVRIDVNESGSLSKEKIEEQIFKVWTIEWGISIEKTSYDSGAIREW